MTETNKIEEVKEDLRMTIGTIAGPIVLTGPEHELMKFLKRLEEPKNRHISIRCPRHLMTTEPWIKIVSVRPSDVTIIVLIEPSKAPRKQNIVSGHFGMGPSKGFGQGPIPIC